VAPGPKRPLRRHLIRGKTGNPPSTPHVSTPSLRPTHGRHHRRPARPQGPHQGPRLRVHQPRRRRLHQRLYALPQAGPRPHAHRPRPPPGRGPSPTPPRAPPTLPPPPLPHPTRSTLPGWLRRPLVSQVETVDEVVATPLSLRFRLELRDQQVNVLVRNPPHERLALKG